jgi:hypothetical protein
MGDVLKSSSAGVDSNIHHCPLSTDPDRQKSYQKEKKKTRTAKNRGHISIEINIPKQFLRDL